MSFILTLMKLPQGATYDQRYIFGNPNSSGVWRIIEQEDQLTKEEIWLRNKKRTMRGEDLSTYSGKMVSPPASGCHAGDQLQFRSHSDKPAYIEDIRHIMIHGKKSCKFVTLILNPLLEEKMGLNEELNDLGIPQQGRSINELMLIIDKKNKSDYRDEYYFVESLRDDMRNKDLSTYSRFKG